MAREFGASIAIDPTAVDVVADIKRLTEGRGADVAIEALGRQDTFEAALRSLRPGGTLSSLGVYSGKLVAPLRGCPCRLGRSAHRHDVVPWRKGAHAATPINGPERPH